MNLGGEQSNMEAENKTGNPNLVNNEESLAFGEITPQNRLQNQIRLAKDLFEKINGEIDHEKFHNDIDFRNNIMNFWSDGDDASYSAAYRRMEKSDWFKNHSELQGDIFKIKVEHLLAFIETEKAGSNLI